MPATKKMISIPEEQNKFAEENEVSLSALVQAQLRAMKNPESDTSQFKYTPNQVLREGRKQGIISMLAGAFILVVGLGLWAFLLVAVPSIWPFVIIWMVGTVVSYYGYHEYSKWNDILWRRSVEDREPEKPNED